MVCQNIVLLFIRIPDKPSSTVGHFVAQVRLVFQPLFTDKLREREYLAYIEPLQPASLFYAGRWQRSNAHL